MSAVDSLMVPKPPAQVSAGISVPGRKSTSGTVFTSRPSRARDLVSDHGGRRSYTRPGRNGCRIGFPGRWNRIQLERIEAFVRRGVLLGLYRPGDPTQTPNLMPTTATTTSPTAY